MERRFAVILCIISSQIVSMSAMNLELYKRPIIQGSLDLCSCDLTTLEGIKDIEHRRNLMWLRLSNNRLQVLPPVFEAFCKLRALNLDGNGLTIIPEGTLGTLTSLEELYLFDNRLRELPQDLFKLIKLRVLFLGQNRLEVLPEKINRLTNLEYLRFNDNQISELPAISLKGLDKLKALDMSNNRLSVISVGALNDLAGLEILLLNNNKLMLLRAGVFKSLYRLKSLNLCDNDLRAILANELANLPGLENLNLANNRLSNEQVSELKFFQENFVSRMMRSLRGKPEFNLSISPQRPTNVGKYQAISGSSHSINGNSDGESTEASPLLGKR